MRRALSLFLPTWSIDRLRRRLNRAPTRDGRSPDALLLTRIDHGREVVASCCGLSHRGGVHAGMTVAHARALLHRRRVYAEPEHPEWDLAALRRLARWAVRLAPVVAVDPPTGLRMDITGCERLYRGEANLVAALTRSLKGLGLRCRVAVAPTYGAAWALSRHGPRAVTILRDPRQITAAISPLPTSALRIDDNVVTELASVAVDRVGQLLELPRAQVADRFGDEVLRRIDEALGRVPEAIEPVCAASPPRVGRVFDGPVKNPDAIGQTVRHLVEAMCDALRRAGLGGRRLECRLDRADADAMLESLTLSRPTRDPGHLWALLRPRVERWHLGHGVDAIELIATQTQPLAPTQAAWAHGQPDDAGIAVNHREEVGRLVDLLTHRLGAQRVLVAEAIDTHVPEKAFRWRSASDAGETCDPRRSATAALTAAAVPMGDRPTTLLQPPVPIDVAILRPEGPAVLLRGHEPQRVISSIGPERIRPRWWRSVPPEASPEAAGSSGTSAAAETESGRGGGPPVRDYYKLQLDGGRWVWVFRELSGGRWFLHGSWE
jgi:protein ImuB